MLLASRFLRQLTVTNTASTDRFQYHYLPFASVPAELHNTEWMNKLPMKVTAATQAGTDPCM